MGLRWSYGVTTVEERRRDLLPRTLESLCRAGFDRPRLLVDNCRDQVGYAEEFGLPVSVRAIDPGAKFGLRTAGNWHLSLLELWIRDPHADRYAVFQDDIVTARNLRAYLDAAPYPSRSYLNLYTFPPPYQVEPLTPEHRGWYLAKRRRDGGPTGKSACALVFDRDATIALLTSRRFLERHTCPIRGFKAIDGGITEALDEVGIKEHVHWPSLIQHTGRQSSRAEVKGQVPFPTAPSFPGEDFDLLTLLA